MEKYTKLQYLRSDTAVVHPRGRPEKEWLEEVKRLTIRLGDENARLEKNATKGYPFITTITIIIFIITVITIIIVFLLLLFTVIIITLALWKRRLLYTV